MKIRIGIPDNPVFNSFIKNIDLIKDKYKLELFRTSETKCTELFLQNRLDVALLSPLGYGSGIGHADFRIIPGPSLSAIGYSGLSSIYFKSSLITIGTIASNHIDDYLIKIGILLLKERYDIDPKIIKTKGSVSVLLKNADAAIAHGEIDEIPVSLDVSEEWFDAYEMPLPVAVWVCKSDEYPSNIEIIVKELFGKKEDSLKQAHHKPKDYTDEIIRTGELFWEFNSDVENAFGQVLQFLYFHQQLNDIPEVKILGREIDNEPLPDVDLKLN